MTAGSIIYHAYVPWLVGKASNVYTQFGEDGLIEACLSQIGTTGRHCFEIGAADGRFFSNTLRLREQGWFAVLIESEQRQFSKLQAEFGDKSTCLHETCTDLDATLCRTAISQRPDLGIIDVDGQDYWLWHDMVAFRPRVMLVEISTRGDVEAIPERGDSSTAQAGLFAITELGNQKGYLLVATTYCNALFVDRECLGEI